jgi:hypothetical protein
MQSIAQVCRSVWWSYAAAGAIALVAAAIVALQVVSAPFGTGAWQLAGGLLIVVAVFRAPGGIRQAAPLFGAGAAGVVLGVAGILIPALDPRVSLVAIGIWSLVAGASYLAVARVIRAFRVPDGGLYNLAWASIGVGIVASTAAAFGLGGSVLAPPAALAVTGVVTIAAALRLRDVADEAPAVLSHRAQRRAERRR